MNVLINATNIKVGGGLQVAVSLIDSLLQDDRDLNLYFLVSSPIYRQINIPELKIERVFVLDIDVKKPLKLLSVILDMWGLERQFSIDVVFSVFGPNFWKPRNAKHIIGFANAWLVDPENRAYTAYSMQGRIFNKLKNYVLGYLLYNNDNHYITETRAVKTLFCKYYSCSHSQIDVVGNCVSPHFNNFGGRGIEHLDIINKVKFLTVSHNYPHKNLDVIGVVGNMLEILNVDFVFVVTFSHQEYLAMDDDFKRHTYNLGPINIADCPSVYNSCDALFLPTLIECFTVSYLEAMATHKVILTSDLPFAHEICGDDALYFDPYDINSIYTTLKSYLVEIGSNKSISNDLLTSYNCRLEKFGDNEFRTNSYVEIIKKKFRGGCNIVQK
jgi:glycosyltransferase involved in cell wall biosynthesis